MISENNISKFENIEKKIPEIENNKLKKNNDEEKETISNQKSKTILKEQKNSNAHQKEFIQLTKNKKGNSISKINCIDEQIKIEFKEEDILFIETKEKVHKKKVIFLEKNKESSKEKQNKIDKKIKEENSKINIDEIKQKQKKNTFKKENCIKNKEEEKEEKNTLLKDIKVKEEGEGRVKIEKDNVVDKVTEIAKKAKEILQKRTTYRIFYLSMSNIFSSFIKLLFIIIICLLGKYQNFFSKIYKYQQKISVAYALDNRYVYPVLISIVSILENLPK